MKTSKMQWLYFISGLLGGISLVTHSILLGLCSLLGFIIINVIICLIKNVHKVSHDDN